MGEEGIKTVRLWENPPGGYPIKAFRHRPFAVSKLTLRARGRGEAGSGGLCFTEECVYDGFGGGWAYEAADVFFHGGEAGGVVYLEH